MKHKSLFLPSGKLGLVLAAALIGTFTGCVTRVERARPGEVYEVAPPVQTTVVIEDDYVYYPHYEMYYSSSRHLYAYRDGPRWVSRPAPRGVTAEVLFASPSVRMTFHDSPARHHAVIHRQYPNNWSPAGHDHDRNDDRKDNRRDDHNDNHSR